MKNNDIELIHRTLDGDETAFSTLVEKYQKQVHALAWRKIGDFHIAEEITQDTFLKAYQKLATLKKPHRLAGWLYVIATRCCQAWLRKKRMQTESLEEIDSEEIEPEAYSRYVAEEEARVTVEAQRRIVKKLLATLPESERTVITLHYFGDMTCEKMGEFLGVSANTIKSRLRRARNRLKKEEPMIREAISNFQISPNLTNNIMREVAQLKPAAPSGSKPLVPWVIGAASAVLIVLMLGISSQYLARFQQPYSLDAQTEMTVELVDTPVVLNINTEPDIQNQLGAPNIVGKNNNNGQKPDEVLLAAAQADGEDVSVSKQQWIQSEPIKGSAVRSLLATSEGELYTFAHGHIYKRSVDGTEWQHVIDISVLTNKWDGGAPMAKWNDTIYIALTDELYASKDNGKTWYSVYSWSEKKYLYPRELVITEQVFYLALMNNILRSEDKGKTWKEMNKGLTGNILYLVEVQNMLFAGTEDGLYRLSNDSWERLKFPDSAVGRILSVEETEEKLYVAAGFNLDVVDHHKVSQGLQRGWWIFRSTDLGKSWTDITPTNAWSIKGWPPEIKLVAAGETLLVMERGMVRSNDAGDTWMSPQTPNTSPLIMSSNSAAVALNEALFYVRGWDGLHRSTDGGKSWTIENVTKDKIQLNNLIVYQENKKRQNMLPTLYARFEGEIGSVGLEGEIIKTTNNGKSWQTVQVEIPMMKPYKEVREVPPIITQMIKSNGVLYAKGRETLGRGKTLFYRVSAVDNTLVPIQSTPIIDSMSLRDHLLFHNFPVEQLQDSFSGATQFFKLLAQTDKRHHTRELTQLGLQGPFAVSDETFYMEYNFKLFRWKQGDTEWYDTGQEETVELSLDIARKDLKLAVSEDTVYVGKRDGHLVVSFDKGTNWIDLTPALPFAVKTFKEIVFAGTTVYVATDAGVTASDNGKNWHAITDAEGTNLIMEHLAVNGTTLYGVTERTGAYRLESGTWERVISEIPDNVTSLSVDGNTLYVGTESDGMLHFTLQE